MSKIVFQHHNLNVKIILLCKTPVLQVFSLVLVLEAHLGQFHLHLNTFPPFCLFWESH